MSYCIGLDIGIASIGYAVLELDANDEPRRIIRLGSRIFDKAENPKDGASLALPRRESRSARRRLRRHRHRLERIRNLIINENILSRKQLESLFDGQLSNIYELRTRALDEKLTAEEFSRILIHLAQRRGFKSNRKVDSKDKESGKLLTAVSENQALLEAGGYRTIGEMFYKDEKFSESKRNKKENYSNTVSRDMVFEEVKLIFATQRSFGCSFAKETVEDEYLTILMSQRSFEGGPGGDSPYGGDQIEKMIGYCTFEKNEKRAVSSSYTFEYFKLLQDINNMRIVSPTGARGLTPDQKLLIRELSYSTANLKYAKLRKELGLNDNERFKSLAYTKPVEEIEKAQFNKSLRGYHEIKKALNQISKDYIKSLSTEEIDIIAYALTVYRTDEKIVKCLNDNGIYDEHIIKAVLTAPNFSKTGHLSIKACKKIIPFLEQGKRYDEACELAGYDFKAHNGIGRQKFLPAVIPEFDDITSPVVRRAVSQSIKVINAIVREQDESPVFVNVELAREMSKSYKERWESERSMLDNQARNERIKQCIREEYNTIDPTGMDIVKFKLWEEQKGICPYSQTVIESSRLFEPGYVDIDHIIPYSISFDDTYKNKVLVKSNENRQKGNKLPLQYLTGDRRDKFIVWVNNEFSDFKKKQRLLKENITEEDEGFKDRNLQDTKYISRVMYNLINDYMEFAPSATDKKRRVYSVNGAITAYMRKRWGINKIREDGDLHHAVDAVVIACVTQGMINKISRYTRNHELEYVVDADKSLVVDRKTGEVLDKFPLPWPKFRQELEIRVSNDPVMYLESVNLLNYVGVDLSTIKPSFVSRMPRRKSTGAAHKDTIRSAKELENGYVISKKSLTDIKLKNGEIEGYYNPGSDILLYTALKNRLLEFGGDAKKAFAEPFYKPTSTGDQGPLVKKVKIMEKSTLNVEVLNKTGVASNDTLIRTDVFYIDGEGYYFVPIYVADTVRDTLPNRACVANKSSEFWKEMTDDNFKFSLYPNDLIKVTSKKDMKLSLVHNESTLPKELLGNEMFLYYVGLDISTGVIQAITHDNTYKHRSIGKTMLSIEKYQVDALGNYTKVNKEKRQYYKR